MRPINRGQTAHMHVVPAPVGGLNTRDALAAMGPQFASVLTNMFARGDRVETRAGYTTLATADTLSMATKEEGFRALMRWSGGTASTDVNFAAFYWHEDVAGTARGRLTIYSVASDGTLTNSLETITLATNNRSPQLGEWTMFGSGSGTNYLVVCFGFTNTGPQIVNSTRVFDGTNWSTPTITNLPVFAVARGVNVHARRLWFYNWSNPVFGLLAYYLPVNSIAGAVVAFDLGPYATKGGRIVAMESWTQDGGEGGLDDLAVFLTSEGQALIYSGTDPSSSSTWRLVGVFDVATVGTQTAQTVVGDNFVRNDCVSLRYGADLVLSTDEGITTAEKVVSPRVDGQDYTLSSTIRPSIVDALVTWAASSVASTSFGSWKLIHLPARKQFIVAVPTARTEVTADPLVYQIVTDWYVMNTETKAWQKFTGINCYDALVVGTHLYVIDGTRNIYKYGSAADDAGTAITFECRQAYSYLNSPNNKMATLMQPMLRATGNFSLTVQADADFNARDISTYTSYTVASAANLQPMISPAQYGRAFAAHLKGQTSAGVVSWYATNWIAKGAGMV